MLTARCCRAIRLVVPNVAAVVYRCITTKQVFPQELAITKSGNAFDIVVNTVDSKPLLPENEVGQKLSGDSNTKFQFNDKNRRATSQTNSEIFGHFNWIGKATPSFSLDGRQIKILREPSEFFEHLTTLSNGSKKRIVLASLYLGTGEKEQELVDSIYDASKRAKENGGNLQVEVLLDYMRGSRGEKNSRTMLLPLVRDFGADVALYHTPDVRGIIKHLLPERYNETVGVSHIKVYIFDDTVIISGANLSDSYFTDRQDRYVVISECPPLADFFQRLVKTVSNLSFHLLANDDLALPCEVHPYNNDDKGKRYKSTMKQKVEEVLVPFSSSCTTSSSNDGMPSTADTVIYPLVQMAPFDVRQDEVVTKRLLESAASDDTIFLASGYLNFTEEYVTAIVEACRANFAILTAAPQANGFYGARGISGAIPDAYSYIAREFCRRVSASCQGHRITLREYFRPKWTVHAKGLWYYSAGDALPCMSMVGSQNYGYRSMFRDLEAQIVIVTRSKDLQTRLHDEQRHLFDYSEPVSADSLSKRHIPLWVTLFTPIIRHFF